MINPDELQKALKLSESGMFDEAAKLYNILLEKDADNYFVLASYGSVKTKRFIVIWLRL